MSTDPDLQLLAEADPAADVTLSPVEAHVFLRATLDPPAGTGGVASEREGRWRRRATRIGAGAIALGVAVPALAYGGSFLAQTGVVVGPGGEWGPDSSELIDILAPDFAEFAATQWPDHAVLPRSYDAREFAHRLAEAMQDREVAWLAKHDPEAVGSTMSVDGLRTDFEFAARCVWMGQWLRSDATGDEAAEAEAATVLAESTTWYYTVSNDGGGVVESLEEVAAAAAAGDRAVLQNEVDLNCPDDSLTSGGGR